MRVRKTSEMQFYREKDPESEGKSHKTVEYLSRREDQDVFSLCIQVRRPVVVAKDALI